MNLKDLDYMEEAINDMDDMTKFINEMSDMDEMINDFLVESGVEIPRGAQ